MEKSSRNTLQRQVIRELFTDKRSHPTADEIYDLARKRIPHISQGTVYRNLNHLVKDGELKRLVMPQGPDHFDPTLANHYHFLCRKCQKVIDIDLPYNEDLNHLDVKQARKIEWHRLVLVGICECCSE